MMNESRWALPGLLIVAALWSASPLGSAADGSGTWENDTAGNWGDEGNWVGDQIANGIGYTADLSILTGSKAITLNGVSQTLGTLIFGSTLSNSSNTRLNASGGATLTMDNDELPALIEAGQGTITVPFIMTSGGLKIVTTGSSATVNGSITLADDVEGVQDLTLAHDGGGSAFSVAAAITEGNSAGQIRLVIDSANTVRVTGENTYTGGILVRKGTLWASVSGLAGSDVNLGDGLASTNVGFSFLSGTYEQKFIVNAAGSGTVTFASALNTMVDTTVSGEVRLGRAASLNVTNNSSINITGDITGSGSLTVGSGTNGAVTLSLSGNNSFNGFSYGYSNFLLNVGSATALGTGAVNIGFDGDNRYVNLRLDNVSGAALTLTPNNPIRFSSFTFLGTDELDLGTGAVTIGAGTGIITVLDKKLTIGGIISGTRNMGNAGAGTLVLKGANTYTGVTYVGGTLSVTSLANGGFASNIGQSASSADRLVLNRGTLDYSGSGNSTDRLFTIGNGGGGIVNNGTGALTFSATGNNVSTGSFTMTFGTNSFSAEATTINVGPSTSVNTTANLAVGQSIQGPGIPENTVIVEILNGSQIVISNPTNAAASTAANAYTFGDMDRTFTLGGTNTGNNTISGVLANSATKKLSVSKSGTGKWILSGANTYTGATAPARCTPATKPGWMGAITTGRFMTRAARRGLATIRWRSPARSISPASPARRISTSTCGRWLPSGPM